MEETKKGASPAPEKKKVDVVKIILILLLLGSLGAGGYFVKSHMDKSTTIVEQEGLIKTATDSLTVKIKELKALQLEFERIKLERESLNLQNDSLDKVILELNADVARYQSGYNKKARELSAVVNKYKLIQAKQDEAIDVYKKRVDSLYASIDTLRQVNTTLSDTITVLKNTNSNLSQMVDLAAVLRTENIQVVSINKKGKESLPLKPDLKAKSIDKLKVTFNVAENPVAKKTTKQIMLRVVEPNEAVLFDMSTGGGFFISEGKEIPYTSKQELDFDNTRQKVSFLYVKGSPYKPGNYTIEIYGDGVKIGDKKFLVK